MRGQNPNKKKVILGLTGSFGSGKTTVARLFKRPCVKIVDADMIAHVIIRPKTPVYKRLISTFGSSILKKNNSISRHKLAKAAFRNKKLLERLNQITHPGVIRMIKKEIISAPQKIIILDAPLLIEAGLKKIADKLIVVKITKEKQIARLKKKTSLSREDIIKRINAQIPLSEKVRMADFVIDNSGTIRQTKKQVEHIRRRLWKN